MVVLQSQLWSSAPHAVALKPAGDRVGEGCWLRAYNFRELQNIKNINNANTITEQRWRRRQVSHSANHGCGYWRGRWSWGRRQTFRPWRGHRGKLLWLVVEGWSGDFEVQRGCHHEWLATAGVLHSVCFICEWTEENIVASVPVIKTEGKKLVVGDF